jgi:hypothetical protein
MAKQNNLAKLAKGGSNKNKPIVKKEEEKVVEKVLTPEEERDLKAKARVDELLEGVDLTIKKDDDLLEVESETEVAPKGTEWLEEQIQRLAEENEKLKTEAEIAKGDYAKIFQAFQELKNGVTLSRPDTGVEIKTKVIQVFNELQSNQLALGDNFIIYPVAFMNRLVMFFPFLEEHKRF